MVILRVKLWRVSVRFTYLCGIGEPDGHSSLDFEDDMTAVEAVETWVAAICNSLSQDYTNLDDHISPTSIDNPRFKPFTL